LRNPPDCKEKARYRKHLHIDVPRNRAGWTYKADARPVKKMGGQLQPELREAYRNSWKRKQEELNELVKSRRDYVTVATDQISEPLILFKHRN
jgi:hypothetical protein